MYPHKGRVDPVPDPLLLRKSGSAGNRTRNFWVSIHELSLHHRDTVLQQIFAPLPQKGFTSPAGSRQVSECSSWCSARVRFRQSKIYLVSTAFKLISGAHRTSYTLSNGKVVPLCLPGDSDSVSRRLNKTGAHRWQGTSNLVRFEFFTAVAMGCYNVWLL
jgi:hypothetical protein